MRHLFLLIMLLGNFSLLQAYNTSEYPPITIENAANLQEVQVLGDGAMNDALAWLPDGRIVVGASRGIYVYENLEAEATFIELGINVSSLLFAGETLFFSDGTSLYSYDLANRQILYSLEGQEPLAVSNQGLLLAYEVDMGVRVLEIATGEVRYDLSYEGILEAEYYSEEEGSSLENSFVYVQFCPNDGGLVVRWVRQYSDEYWEGGYLAGNDIWMFNEAPQPIAIEYDFMSYGWDFAALDANWNFFAVDEESIHNANASFSLDLQDGESIAAEFDSYRYAVKGNFFAAPVFYYHGGGYWEQSTKIWDVITGELVANLPASGHIAFSPDGSKVAIGRHIFELATGEELAFLQTDTYRLLRGLQDRILNFGWDDSLRLLDAATYEEIATLPLRVSELYERPYMAHADGSFLLLAKNQELAIRIDGNTGAEIARFVSDEIPLSNLYFSPDMRYLVNEYYSEPAPIEEIWDARTGEAVSLPTPYHPLYPYFYRDSTVIAWDSNTKEVVFYDMSTASISHRYPVTLAGIEGFGVTLNFSPDKRYMLIDSAVEHIVWSVESETVVLNIEAAIQNQEFNPNSSFFAYQTNETVSVANLLDGSVILEIQVEQSYMTFAADGIIVLQDWDDYENTTYLDVITGEEVEAPVYEPKAMYEANGLSFFSDEMGIRLECNNHHVLAMLDTGSVSSMSISSDGKLLYMSYRDGRVSIWAVVE